MFTLSNESWLHTVRTPVSVLLIRLTLHFIDNNSDSSDRESINQSENLTTNVENKSQDNWSLILG